MRYRIKEFRVKAGLTQQELADRVGCSRQYLNELENKDARNVSSRLILAIADVLKCDANEIFLSIKSDISD